MSNTEEYLKAHGYVEGQINEIRLGDVLLRFPAGVRYSPHTNKEIIKGQADDIDAGIYHVFDENYKSHLDLVRIQLRPYGGENLMAWERINEKEIWKHIIQRDDLGLVEYHRKISGGWGGVTYIAQSNEDKTPNGNLIQYACSEVNDKISECWNLYLHKNGIIVSYYMSGNNLKNWKIIHAEVVKFVDSIIVEE